MGVLQMQSINWHKTTEMALLAPSLIFPQNCSYQYLYAGDLQGKDTIC